MMFGELDFIVCDLEVIMVEIVVDYEVCIGKMLYLVQVECVLVDIIVYCEIFVCVGIQEVVKQNFVVFVCVFMIDYFGELVGVMWLLVQFVKMMLCFLIEEVLLLNLLIVVGMCVEMSDGVVLFVIDIDVMFVVGQLLIDVVVMCEIVGLIGNGWQLG